MIDLRQERRDSVRFLLDNVSQIWNEQKELVIGLGMVGALTYAWILVR